jgi:hypothetical protein
MDKRKPFYFYISILWTWPNDILVFLIVLIFHVLWGENLHWNEGPWTVLRKDSWPARTWYKRWGATTLGHGGFINYGRAGGPGTDTKIEFHEHKFHVQQFEVMQLVYFTNAVILILLNGDLGTLELVEKVFVGMVPVGSWITYFLSMVMSVLRGNDAYKGNIWETAANVKDTDFYEDEKHSDR